MFADDEPPSYDQEECVSSPTYSTYAGTDERVIRSQPRRLTGCPACEWTFNSKHMKINMGPRVWGLHAPSYGLNGKVEGSIKFSGDRDSVERVTATLEGYLATVVTKRGSGSGISKLPIISRTIPLYVSYMGNSFQWDQEHSFSIPIPSEINVQGVTSPSPPSFLAYHQDASCDIFYVVKFRMSRKGLRRQILKTIPILYLPKTRPSEPSFNRMPRSRQLRDTFLSMFDRVKTVNLTPYWHLPAKRISKSASLDCFSKSIYFSLPAPQCFTSGESVPFTLSLVFPKEPVLAKILTRHIRIVLLKRVQLRRKGLRDVVSRDTTIATASMEDHNEYTEGISLLRGAIQAGRAGRETSWRVDGVAEVQYVVCVLVRPPSNLVNYVPSFRHEEVLEIKTDNWGTLERELISTGGTPTPALGLASDLRSS